MRVFNEEAKSNSAEVVLIVTREEGKRLIEAVEAASKANPRKTTWAVLVDQLYKACVY